MILTIPNIISVVRIAAIPFFLWLLLAQDDPVAAAWVIGPIGATDWVDGYLARRLDQVSELGKFLDPAADRLAVAAAVAGGWISGHLPWPVAAAIALREAVVIVGALVLALRGRTKLEVRYIGKVATFGLYFAIPFFLLHSGTGWAWQAWVAWGLAVPSLILYYVVAAQYLGDMTRLLRGSDPVSSDAKTDQETHSEHPR